MLRRRDASLEPTIAGRSLRQGRLDCAQLGSCKLWVTAEFGITLASGKVSKWLDQSVAGNHLVQATANYQPDFANADSDFRGAPAVDFTPAAFPLGHDRMGTAAADLITQPVTIAVAFLNQKTTAAGSGYSGYLVKSAAGNGIDCLILFQGNAGGTDYRGLWSAGTAYNGTNYYAPNVARSIAGIYHGTSSYAFMDKVVEGNKVNMGTRSHEITAVGDPYGDDDAQWYFDGKVAEMAIWDRALSVGELDAIIDTWSAKYGIKQ